MREFFRFPDPVNEVAARLVAGGVVLLCLAFLVTGASWLLVLLAGGFVARVLFGPRVSPLALLVTRVLVPALPLDERPTPGPPKRFAQGIGATFSVSAAVLWFGFGWELGAYVLVAASFSPLRLNRSSASALVAGFFSVLMRAGLIPESACEACADISRRRVPASS